MLPIAMLRTHLSKLLLKSTESPQLCDETEHPICHSRRIPDHRQKECPRNFSAAPLLLMFEKKKEHSGGLNISPNLCRKAQRPPNLMVKSITFVIHVAYQNTTRRNSRGFLVVSFVLMFESILSGGCPRPASVHKVILGLDAGLCLVLASTGFQR